MKRKLSLKELREAFEKGGDLQNIECDWEKLNGWDWIRLLSKQPQFADKCDWEKLDGEDWSSLLEEHPQFAEKCDWEKLDGWDWSGLLCKHPQFAEKCDWEKLGGAEWRSLLCKQPQFAEKCDWEKLDGGNWCWLLCKQPQFAEKCDWEKLNGDFWSGLLCKQPQFADKCDWEKLNGDFWSGLLCKQPQFADKCDWEKLDGWDWGRLLSRQPQFADKCKLYQILFLKQEGDSIVVYCKGERKFAWDLYDGGALITAIDELWKIIERLPLDDAVKLVKQGITIDTEDISLTPTLKAELNLEVWNINDYADDEEDDWDDEDNDLDDEIVCEQQESAVEFDEKGKYYLYRDNFARENQRTFDTIAEAYDFLCQDSDGACIFFCDGYGESQKPPTLDWLKKVINSCGKVEVEIGFPDGAKDIWIYQKER